MPTPKEIEEIVSNAAAVVQNQILSKVDSALIACTLEKTLTEALTEVYESTEGVKEDYPPDQTLCRVWNDGLPPYYRVANGDGSFYQNGLVEGPLSTWKNYEVVEVMPKGKQHKMFMHRHYDSPTDLRSKQGLDFNKLVLVIELE